MTQGPLPPTDSSPVPRPPDSPTPGSTISRNRMILAFGVALASDLLSMVAQVWPPFEWALDLATALALFGILGWQWLLLPALIAEAIPGLATLPTWLMVVSGIALLGKARRPDRQ